MTLTVRKKLSCPNCSQVFWARAPADPYTEVTFEYCEFPDFDFVQNYPCENCDSMVALYWHNRALEKKRLLELKELSYLKERYLAYNIARSQGHQHIAGVGIKEVADSLTEDREYDKRLDPILDKMHLWLEEFTKQRMDTLDITPSQRRRIDAEVRARVRKFAKDFAKYAREKGEEWKQTDEYKNLPKSTKKPLKTEPSALGLEQDLKRVSEQAKETEAV
jgi:hypothetical protein